MTELDAKRFPTVARYLEMHGGRLDRYPECQGKGGLLRDVIDSQALKEVADALPAPVVELLRNPPPVNVWTSEMAMEVAFQALADVRFPSAEEAEEWVFTQDLERFKGRLYRLLMVVMTPQGMLRAAGKRWEAFHRGTTLAVQAAKRHAVGVLRFPEYLYLPDSKINMCGSFRAALTACGAIHPVVKLTDATPTEHIYEATWD